MLEKLKLILESISGFEGKVAYRMFQKDENVTFPFITYLVTDSDNFIADGIVYKEILNVDIELYTSIKSPATEKLIEEALSNHGIAWNKDENYLKEERCYMINYTISIEGE